MTHPKHRDRADVEVARTRRCRCTRAFARRSRVFRLSCCLVLPLLAACGGDDDPSPTPTPTVQATATTPAGPTEVLPVVWTVGVTPGTNAPEEPVDQFTVDAETIYAVVRVTNVPQGAVMSAAWTYNGVPVEPASSSVTATAPIADGYVEFHLSHAPEEVWPDGAYAVAITLDGKVVQIAQVDVIEP